MTSELVGKKVRLNPVCTFDPWRFCVVLAVEPNFIKVRQFVGKDASDVRWFPLSQVREILEQEWRW